VDHRAIVERLCRERRDLVSQGYDNALGYLSGLLPELEIHGYPSGTEVWNWIIPDRWEVDAAWVAAPDGRRIIDIDQHGLHVASYSQPIRRRVSHGELMAHLITRPDAADAVPFGYRYYRDDWAFCLQHNRLPELCHEYYDVLIDSRFEPGRLKVGEVYLPGAERDEIVLIGHLCHPFQANDNASGIAVLMGLADKLRNAVHQYSYRIILCPETIGSIAYLAHNEHLLHRMRYGIALDMLGNSNRLIAQLTPGGNTQLDRAAELVIGECAPYRMVIGNDERVLNSVGVRVPTISISRAARWGETSELPFRGYHSSMDTPDALDYDLLAEAQDAVEWILTLLDVNFSPQSRCRGPIMLSRHDLWIDPGDDHERGIQMQMVLDLLDGKHTVIDIAHQVGIDPAELLAWLYRMREKELIG